MPFLTPLKITVLSILAAIGIGLLIFDIYLASNTEKGDTISELIGFYSLRSMLLPAVAGILIGHFWWPTAYDISGWLTLAVLVPLGLWWFGIDMYMLATKGDLITNWGLGFLRKWPIINVAIHTVIGHFIWGQYFTK